MPHRKPNHLRTTSTHITIKNYQMNYLYERDLNLSAMVQTMLDQIIQGDPEYGKKTKQH